MEKERIYPAAYLPLATFLTALDHLAAISIPNKIEGRTFPSMSSQSTSQLISGLKFFNLISEDGTPQPLLSELAHNPDNRKTLIRQLIETHYPDIVALDFAKITPTQLETALADKKYNVAGDTRKKAKTFLLKAAQYAGYTVHPLLTKVTRKRRKGSEGKPPTNTGKAVETNGNGDSIDGQSVIHPPKPRGSERTVNLKSGAGSVTLSLNVDLLGLDEGDDRDFVFDLIDKIRAYEKRVTVSTDEKDKVEKEAGE